MCANSIARKRENFGGGAIGKRRLRQRRNAKIARVPTRTDTEERETRLLISSRVESRPLLLGARRRGMNVFVCARTTYYILVYMRINMCTPMVFRYIAFSVPGGRCCGDRFSAVYREHARVVHIIYLYKRAGFRGIRGIQRANNKISPHARAPHIDDGGDDELLFFDV